MLEVLLSEFWVYLVIGQWLMQTFDVSSFTEWILGLFGNWPVINAVTLS